MKSKAASVSVVTSADGRHTRRELLIAALGLAAGVVVRPVVESAAGRLAGLLRPEPASGATGAAAPGWTFSPANPVLNIEPASPWDNAAVYDPAVARAVGGTLWMWYSTRGDNPPSIAVAVDSSGAGDQWRRLAGDPIVQPKPAESAPYGAITRPSVLATPEGWRMWYSVVNGDSAWIGAASSPDGIAWTKHGSPVLTPRDPWEKTACQCPNVLYDASSKQYRMWYCGGELYEPDAIGYAVSPDGYTWTRAGTSPIYAPTSGWEDHKIGSFQVHQVGDWHYAFYNAFQRTPFVSRVGMARSRDGVTGWEHHPHNPILGPGKVGEWNGAMIYKPTALWNGRLQRWDVWFNASDHLNGHERIGHAWSAAIW